MMIDIGMYIILGVFLTAFLAKSYLLFLLVYQGITRLNNIQKVFLLGLALLGSIFTDFTWVMTYSRILFFPIIDLSIIHFFIRIAWSLCLVQYQSLGIFIESLTESNYSLSWYQKILLFFNSLYAGYFIFIAFYNFFSKEQFFIEKILMKYGAFIVCILLLTVFFVLKKINKIGYSKILRQQLITLLKFVVFPLICMEIFLGIYALLFSDTHYVFAGILSILYTFASYYCVAKIMRLRFLNLSNHVRDLHSFPFFKKFRQEIINLSNVNHMEQLEPIVQMAFKDIFALDASCVHLYFRQSSDIRTVEQRFIIRPIKKIEQIVESFLEDKDDLYDFVRYQRIIIYDEIIFNNTYQANTFNDAVIQFLDAINADVFIPIFKDNSLVAYVIIARNARAEKLFSDIECDEMILYVASLENVINIFHNHQLSRVVEREKQLQEELFIKHQEINQCRESLETFNRIDKYRSIGIVTYTSYRKFAYLNQDAKDILAIDLNDDQGHWITREVQQLAKDVLWYKIPKTHTLFDEKNEKIVIRAVPYLEKNNVLLIMYHPEVMDSIKQVQQLLGKPSEIDYLLYLETTQAGKLINKLIPSAGPCLIQFKINMLKLALSQKALMIDVPDEDEEDMVAILHTISMREVFKLIEIGPQCCMTTLARDLFGINKIYGMNSHGNVKPLLESLHAVGTLFIKNIHYMSLELQDMLAEYIRYGYYRVYKSDHKIASSVRIICSSRQDLKVLAQEKKFSKALFEQLSAAQLVMPSLADLSETEYSELLQSFEDQILGHSQNKEFIEFIDKERDKLIVERSLSLKHLKTRMLVAVKLKSGQKSLPLGAINASSSFSLEDSFVSKAAKMGKNALKDSKMLVMLMKRFKTQSKVAEILGVHRSAVYKRLKQFNLLIDYNQE